MKTQSVCYCDETYQGDLLARLRGNVFHLTSITAFREIQKSGCISHTQKSPHGDSLKSFGRSKGWICLFDLRDISPQEMSEALNRYYFLKPHWSEKFSGEYSESDFICLFLSDSYYEHLIPNGMGRSQEKSKNVLYIPKVECWSSKDIPVSHFREILHVKIKVKVSPFSRILHEVSEKMQNKNRKS